MPPETPENPAPVDDTRRGLRPRKMQWGLPVAIVVGGAIAFGLVQLMPDNWRITLRKNSKPDGRMLTGQRQPNFRMGSENPETDSGKSAGKTAGKSAEPDAASSKRKASPTATKEDREAAELLKEAKALIAEGKKDEAVSRLTRILNDFVNTAAADEARKLLTGL